MTEFIHGVEVVEVLDGTRPIQTPRFSIIGVIGTAPAADAAKFPLDTPVSISNPTAALALGVTGTLLDQVNAIYKNGGGTVVVVRVDEGADETATLAKVKGQAASNTGVHAFLLSEAHTGVAPRILIAPGFTHQRPGDAANPVVAELKAVLGKLRATSVVDGPNTTDVAAKVAADECGSDRILFVDPRVLVSDEDTGLPVPNFASSLVAGGMASRGFWLSPSNKVLAGVVGMSRIIEHRPQDSDGQSNTLNADNIAVIIRRDGFRLWGNRGTGQDPLTAFISVRRTMDAVSEAVERAHDWAIDRPLSSQLALDIIDSVNAYLRELRSRGAILGGEASLNPELNTAEVLKSGRLYVDFDLEPAAPLERLTFTLYRNDGYYDELVNNVLSVAG